MNEDELNPRRALRLFALGGGLVAVAIVGGDDAE
jgi:hypothetical protein